ncbi:MAG: hypothetical protein WA843_00990 [Candidatus Saccharimonadales bacterium]
MSGIGYELSPDLRRERDITPTITWEELARDLELTDRMIGSTTLFSAPEMFVGQETAKNQLTDFMQSAPDGAVALIRGRFGTGKTALTNRVLHDLEVAGVVNPDDVSYEFSNMSSSYGEQRYVTKKSEPPIVIMEEVGRGAISTYLTSIKEAREAGKIKRLVVNGDDTLNDPKFLEAIGASEQDVTRIDLESLTPELFREIMKTRLNAVWELQQINKTVASAPLGDIPAIITELQKLNESERYTDEVMNSLFDSDFLKAMLPRTEHPVTEIRSSLVLLTNISRCSQFKGPARFDGIAYRNFREQEQEPRLTTPEKDTLLTLYELINDLGENELFPAMNAKKIMLRVVGNTWRLEEYIRSADKLSRYGLLRPFEVSDLGEDDERLLTARFVPDSKVFLDAKFYQDDAIRREPTRTDFIPVGDTLEERADSLLEAWRVGMIDRRIYRREWPRLLASSAMR